MDYAEDTENMPRATRSPSPPPRRDDIRSPTPERRRSNSRGRRSPPPVPRPRHAPADPEPTKVVGVFGLSVRTNEQDLEDEFGRIGAVEKVVIVYDARSSRSRGFGFVTMKSLDDAAAVIKELNGIELHGRRLRVDYSVTTKPHDPTPGEYRGEPRREDDVGGRGGPYGPPPPRGWGPLPPWFDGPPGRPPYGGGFYGGPPRGGPGGFYGRPPPPGMGMWGRPPPPPPRSGGGYRGGPPGRDYDDRRGGPDADDDWRRPQRDRSYSPPRRGGRGDSRSPPPRRARDDDRAGGRDRGDRDRDRDRSPPRRRDRD